MEATKASRERSGDAVFRDTMADMTYPEIEAAARQGAVVLWAMGVIEQHGPHLPLATDVYIPSAVLRRARTILSAKGVPSVTAPAFYWGVNHVTGRFPGSFQVRPEVMIELIKDVFASLAKDGFKSVFCLSGHGDALHNRTIYEAVKQGSAAAGITGKIVASSALVRRLGFDAADPCYAVSAPVESGPPPAHLDIHAGEGETSMVLALHPTIVRRELLPGLKSTALGPADLAEWRKGADSARRVTPLGYFGDPASARAERGEVLLAREADAVAAAILAAVRAVGGAQ